VPGAAIHARRDYADANSQRSERRAHRFRKHACARLACAEQMHRGAAQRHCGRGQRQRALPLLHPGEFDDPALNQGARRAEHVRRRSRGWRTVALQRRTVQPEAFGEQIVRENPAPQTAAQVEDKCIERQIAHIRGMTRHLGRERRGIGNVALEDLMQPKNAVEPHPVPH
jgi:hypothetical protein